MLEIIEEILKIFAKNGLFDEGVELIGSWSFLVYQKHLGARSLPFVTHDVDFLIPNPFHGKDLEQAICTSTIVDVKVMVNRFKKFPKGWQTDILKVLARAEKNLPLYFPEIERINLALQSSVKS